MKEERHATTYFKATHDPHTPHHHLASLTVKVEGKAGRYFGNIKQLHRIPQPSHQIGCGLYGLKLSCH